MREQLISFETAKLAKKKGFKKIFCHYGYKKSGKVTVMPSYYDAPSQSLLQKWLREVHNIDVNVLPYNKTKKEYEVYVDLAVTTWSGYKTYEEALEIGLQEALKLIK